MTDYGLLVINQADNVQIDSYYTNFARKQTGTVSSVVSGTNYIDFTNTSDTPFIAIKLDNSYYSVPNGYVLSGANYDKSTLIADGSIANVPWALWVDNYQAPYSGEYGMLVYNSSGDIVFSSEDRYLKVIGIRNVSLPSTVSGDYWPTGTDDVTVEDADNNYFMVSTHSWFIRDDGDTNRYVHTIGMKKIDSTTIRVRYIVAAILSPLGNPGQLAYSFWSYSNDKIIEIEL